MSNKFENMYEYPLQSINDFCNQCEILERAYAEKENGELTKQTLGELREACTKCRGGAWKNNKRGIYKGDAILGAYSPSKRSLPPGKGRHSIIPESAIQAILRQSREGHSCREIARRTGYSVPTVSKIIKKNK